MAMLALTLALFALHALAGPIRKRQAPSFIFNGDAPFSVDAQTLAAALTCPNGVPTASSPPVLLVHGQSQSPYFAEYHKALIGVCRNRYHWR